MKILKANVKTIEQKIKKKFSWKWQIQEEKI